MKQLITVTAILFLTGMFLQATAQVTIKGVIRDNKNNPVQGVSIAIRDSYDGATSDSTGRYSFKTTEKGRLLLVISSIG
jgi:vitamin B12 transporter